MDMSQRHDRLKILGTILGMLLRCHCAALQCVMESEDKASSSFCKNESCSSPKELINECHVHYTVFSWLTESSLRLRAAM